jgi:hypothetical protein
MDFIELERGLSRQLGLLPAQDAEPAESLRMALMVIRKAAAALTALDEYDPQDYDTHRSNACGDTLAAIADKLERSQP